MARVKKTNTFRYIKGESQVWGATASTRVLVNGIVARQNIYCFELKKS
jgi:hypothetical protein